MTNEEYQELAREFATRLKPWRLTANMTQEELGALCGISSKAISLIENGEHLATKRHMLDIIKSGFEVSFERFFTETPMHRTRHQRVTGCTVPNLKAWRQNRGLTAKKLASLVFVSPAQISHIENGGNASRALAQRIANMLELSLKEMEQSPIHVVGTDPEKLLASGKSRAEVAREFDEEYVKAVRDRMSNQEIDGAVAAWLAER